METTAKEDVGRAYEPVFGGNGVPGGSGIRSRNRDAGRTTDAGPGGAYRRN